MAQVEQGQVPQIDQDHSAAESIKVETTSKGIRWSVRVVKQSGELDTQWFSRLVNLTAAMEKHYGQGV